MRLKIYRSGDTVQLQQLDAGGRVVRVKPATRDEVWLIEENARLNAELLRLNDENNQLAARVQEMEACSGAEPETFDPGAKAEALNKLAELGHKFRRQQP